MVKFIYYDNIYPKIEIYLYQWDHNVSCISKTRGEGMNCIYSSISMGSSFPWCWVCGTSPPAI